MIIAHIDKDYISNPDEKSRVGLEWTTKDLREWWVAQLNPANEFEYVIRNVEQASKNKTRFRCLDDDGEIYYGGWLYNDDDCFVQMLVLSFCQYDAGTTEIQIKTNNGWKAEIG